MKFAIANKIYPPHDIEDPQALAYRAFPDTQKLGNRAAGVGVRRGFRRLTLYSVLGWFSRA